MRLPTAFSGLVHTLVQQDPAFGTWVQLHRGTGQGDLTALALISTLTEAAVLWVSLDSDAAFAPCVLRHPCMLVSGRPTVRCAVGGRGPGGPLVGRSPDVLPGPLPSPVPSLLSPVGVRVAAWSGRQAAHLWQLSHA